MTLEVYLQSRLEDLDEDKDLMVNYLNLKLNEGDWHGVADAAMDIRDLEAEKQGVEYAMRNIKRFP